MRVIHNPEPATGGGRYLLVHELRLTNLASRPLTLARLRVAETHHAKPATLNRDALRCIIGRPGRGETRQRVIATSYPDP